MSSGRELENGFMFEVNDPEQKTQFRFSLTYHEGFDMFFFVVNLDDHRAVGDEHAEYKPYQSNTQIRYWITPDRARIMFNPKFWDDVKNSMSKIHEKREAENI